MENDQTLNIVTVAAVLCADKIVLNGNPGNYSRLS